MTRKPENDLAGRLKPGQALVIFSALDHLDGTSVRRQRTVQLLSRMSSAMRERADDQSRSAVRSETESASAVSAVVKPAK